MSKLKEALYYAIRTGALYNPVIAVTTERPNGRWHGRRWQPLPGGGIYWEVTHGTVSDLSGRFDSLEAALHMRKDIADLADKYDASRKALSDAVSAIYRQERRAMDELIAGRQPTPPPVVIKANWNHEADALVKQVLQSGGIVIVPPEVKGS